MKQTSTWVMLLMMAEKNLELEHMDIKTTFLHGDIKETIYMEQPEGLQNGNKDQVCLLKRTLYGLKQSPRQWNKKFNIIEIGFERSSYDACVYFKKNQGNQFIYLLLYVDEILLAGTNKTELDTLIDELNSRFEMKNLGPARRILGMKIVRDGADQKLYLTQ